MASVVFLHGVIPAPVCSRESYYRNRTVALSSSRLLPLKSLSKLKQQSPFTYSHVNSLRRRRIRHSLAVYASQSDLFRVLQKAWNVGKEGIEAGTSLVPDFVPRPIVRIFVTVVVLSVSLFLLKSFLSTVFFVLAMMGLIYFAFITLNKDEGPKGGGGTPSTEDSLEEARRIMEKYK